MKFPGRAFHPFVITTIICVVVTTIICVSAGVVNAAETCVKPFTIADRWVEVGDPPWRSNSTFNPDEGDYYTRDSGFDSERDRGLQLTLRAARGDNVIPSFYNSWALPGGTGANWYRANIGGCNAVSVEAGLEIALEAGNMAGPTAQGVGDLLTLDPEAAWDTNGNCVRSTQNPSPRVIVFPLYDPVFFVEATRNNGHPALRVTTLLTAFVEGLINNSVVVRITPRGSQCRPEPEDCADNVDNDLDGLTDSDDPDCIRQPTDGF